MFALTCILLSLFARSICVLMCAVTCVPSCISSHEGVLTRPYVCSQVCALVISRGTPLASQGSVRELLKLKQLLMAKLSHFRG